jgi:hypothetical protein
MPTIGYKLCPFCKEEVRADAIVCRYCGMDISSRQQKINRFIKLYIRNLIIVVIGIVVIIVVGNIIAPGYIGGIIQGYWLLLGPIGLLLIAVWALPGPRKKR